MDYIRVEIYVFECSYHRSITRQTQTNCQQYTFVAQCNVSQRAFYEYWGA